MTSVDELPTGTVTLLFTDIEGSTQLLKQLREGYAEVLGDHQRILRDAFAAHGGREIDTQGDAFFVAFRRAKDGLAAAIDAQERLAAHSWPEGAEVRVRMGLHTGEPSMGGSGYVGLGVHRAARICAAGHGGQVLLSQSARELLRDDPIDGVTLRDLGEHALKDLDEPERLYQAVAPGLREEFPALRTASGSPFEGREGELEEAAVEELAPGSNRRRGLIAVGVVGVVLVAGLLAAVVLRDGGGGLDGVDGNAVGVLDPANGNISDAIPLGSPPSSIAVGDGGIWVTNQQENTVAWIDVDSTEIRPTEVGGSPEGVGVGAGTTWVANGLDGTVSRVDQATGRVVQTVPVGNGPTGVVAGGGSVWVTNATDGTVTRLDPGSGDVKATYPTMTGVSGIAFGFDRVWVVSPSAGAAMALDARTGRIARRISVGVEPQAVATGAGAVWVTNRADGTVSRIDPRTLSVTRVVEVGRSPDGVAATNDAVWVANGGDGTVSRIDPESGDVSVTDLGSPPHGIAASEGGVYVTVRSSGDEHRGGTLRALGFTEFASLDPAVDGFTLGQLLALTNNGLVAYRKVGGARGSQLVPDLATAIPVPTDGGTAYTFEVRRGIRYSTGALVQPADFRRAIERTITFGYADPYFAGIVGADRCRQERPCDLAAGIVVDRAARTVTFRLTEPDPSFLAKLTLPFAAAVPASTPARDQKRRPLPATGPYRIASVTKDGRVIRLVRNPAFEEWSADAQPRGYPDVITISGRNESRADDLKAVEQGKADIALERPEPPDRRLEERLALQYPGQLRVNPSLGWRYFFLNTRIEPFDDVRVRRAVNLAFDRDAAAGLLGLSATPTCRIIPPNIPASKPDCPYGESDLDAARRLVRTAGVVGADVKVWTIAGLEQFSQPMVETLRSLGFRARIQVSPDFEKFFTAVADPATRAQIGNVGWIVAFPAVVDVIPPLLTCASYAPDTPEANSNYSGFCDPKIDADIRRATTADVQDPAAATALWQEVETAILEQAPHVSWAVPGVVDFHAERVGNYQYNPQLGVLLSQLWVK